MLDRLSNLLYIALTLIINIMGKGAGFTLVELLVVTVVLLILLAVIQFVPTYLLADSRDTERVDDAQAIARRLEQSYNAQEIGKPAYPSTAKFISDISNRSGTVERLDYDSLVSPGESSSSVKAALYINTSYPLGGDPVTPKDYVYQPLTQNNDICDTAAKTCVKFNLYYKLERTNELKSIKSMYQQ